MAQSRTLCGIRCSLLAIALLLLATSCTTLNYDLSSIPIAISAKPAPPGAKTEAFRIEAKSVLWAHGLFGETKPDVTELVRNAAKGAQQITDFRVTTKGKFHDWLITHLSLTLVRGKTVVIEGQVVREPSR